MESSQSAAKHFGALASNHTTDTNSKLGCTTLIHSQADLKLNIPELVSVQVQESAESECICTAWTLDQIDCNAGIVIGHLPPLMTLLTGRDSQQECMTTSE